MGSRARLNGYVRPIRAIGDELYALPPTDFTAARDRYVAEAKNAGDRVLAREIAAMKRPTVAGWLVNLVALRTPESVARLIELGTAIREAQGSVPPAQLRDLSAQRRRALDAIVSRAQALAAECGSPAPPRALTEAESTLAAAMADESVAELVRTGRAIRAVSYSGFGEAGVGGTGPVLPRTGRTGTRTTDARATGTHATGARGGTAMPPADAAGVPEAADARLAQAQRLEAARARLAEARDRHDAAAAAEREANDLTGRLATEINDLRERLDLAQREARLARQRRLAAERDLGSAERRLARTE